MLNSRNHPSEIVKGKPAIIHGRSPTHAAFRFPHDPLRETMATQDQFLDVIDRDEAERRFHAAIRLEPLGVEQVPLGQALGRVAAGDIAAMVDVPSFDRSNFDGYAVVASDTYGASEESPRRVQLLKEVIAAAVVPQSMIRPGTAAAIATGGMLPRGADAIVMVEDTDEEAGRLLLRRPVVPGAGVTFAGTDIAAGETVLRTGDELTSRETGVLAAIGVVEVGVFRRPRVTVLSTGDEIIAPGTPMTPGKIYDSNSRVLADAVRELGGQPQGIRILPDDRQQLESSVLDALENSDVVLLSGGTSKGQGDLCYRVIRELTRPGILAHGVALKPGKPICLAAHGDKPVVILPGFPTSAMFTFHEFVAPVIRRLAGRAARSPTTVRARLAVKVNSVIGRTEYLLVGLVPREMGSQPRSSLAAYPMGKGSGSVTAFSRADGFVTIGRHAEILQEGTEVDVQLLGRDLRLADLVVIGSHCVGLDLLLGRLQQQGFRTKFLAVGSTGGLNAVRSGECDVAGIHLLDPVTNTYNQPFLTPGLQLITGYGRLQGVLYRPGDKRFEGRAAAEAVAAVRSDPECVMVNRNPGSGTRILIDRLLGDAQPPGFGVLARSHNAVAAAVAQGRADWGIAIQNVAGRLDLGFLPLTDERFDFAVRDDHLERPAVRALRRLLEDTTVRGELAAMGFRD
jgi:putative molybdopterin biosynthesis protein